MRLKGEGSPNGSDSREATRLRLGACSGTPKNVACFVGCGHSPRSWRSLKNGGMALNEAMTWGLKFFRCMMALRLLCKKFSTFRFVKEVGKVDKNGLKHPKKRPFEPI